MIIFLSEALADHILISRYDFIVGVFYELFWFIINCVFYLRIWLIGYLFEGSLLRNLTFWFLWRLLLINFVHHVILEKNFLLIFLYITTLNILFWFFDFLFIFFGAFTFLRRGFMLLWFLLVRLFNYGMNLLFLDRDRFLKLFLYFSTHILINGHRMSYLKIIS